MNRYRYVIYSAAIAAIGAAAAVVLWPSQQPVGYSLLAGYRHDSITYFNKQAQDWMSKPAAASKAWRWKMQEASGNITDDLSGDSAVLTASGSPTYSLFTPIPMSAGFTRKAIGFNGTDALFAASSSTVGDITTGNFTMAWWGLVNATQAGDRFFSKRTSPGGGTGFELYGAINPTLYLSDGAHTINSAFGASAIAPGWHLIVVRVNRASTAVLSIDNQDVGSPIDVSSVSGSVTNNGNLTLGRYSNAGGNYLNGSVAEALIADGLITTTEIGTWYKAFKVPTGITYSQTTTTKRILPSDSLGQRLGVYAAGQWPASYDATLVSTANPAGLGFPRSPSTTNDIGYPNNLDQSGAGKWTVSGAVVAANGYEAPDGSMTADSLTFSADTQSLTKAVAAGVATIAAGERWCASIYARKISGTCVGVGFYADTSHAGTTTAFTDAATWTRYTACDSTATHNKGIAIYATTHGSCVMALAEAQYEQNNVTDPCTSTAGNVSQTCNASYYTIDWSVATALMPQALTRGEVLSDVSSAPWVAAPSSPRTIWQVGQQARLTVGIEPVGILYDQGGGIEFMARAKPLSYTTTYRQYRFAWDTDVAAGINSSPKTYAAMTVDNKVAPVIISPRNHNATSGLLYQAPSQRDLNGTVLSVGCDPTGSNCSYGAISRVELYTRPSPDQRGATDTDNLITISNTEAGYLNAQAIPRFEKPAGALAANTWIWDMTALGGSLYDRINGIALAPTGSPRYQAFTGLLARGQGRRSMNFVAANTMGVKAPSTTPLAFGNPTNGATVSTLINPKTCSNYDAVVSTQTISAYTQGYSMYLNSACKLTCMILDVGGNYTYSNTADVAAIPTGQWTHAVCAFPRSGATWAKPILYLNAAAQATTNGVQTATGSLANTQAFAIGSGARGALTYFNGQIGEVKVEINKAMTAGEVLTEYQQSTQQGAYWTDDAYTAGHFYLNEASVGAGIGLRDHSGNGNHLTVLGAAAPTVQFADLPYPMGTGLTKPAIGVSGTSDIFSSAATTTANVSGTQPWSIAAWIRVAAPAPGFRRNVFRHFGAGSPYGVSLQYHPDDYWISYFGDLGIITTAAGIADSRWHLVALKLVWDGAHWNAQISQDGAAFGNGAARTAANAIGNPNVAIDVGEGAAGISTVDIAGLMITNNYALTDADVASYAKFGAKTNSLITYARANASCFDVGSHQSDGMQVACFGANQYPYAYASTAVGVPGNARLGLGQPVAASVTNLTKYGTAFNSWTGGQATVVANSVAAPDGTLTADSLVEDGSVSGHYVVTAAASVAPSAATARNCIYAKKGTRNWVFVQTTNNTSPYGYFNVSTCTPGTMYAGATNATATGVGGGWCLCCFDWTATAAAFNVYIGGASADADPNYSYAGVNGTIALYLWSAEAQQPPVTGLHCPTTGNATATCSGPTSNYVASASMTGWDRVQGAIGVTAVPGASGAYALQFEDGADQNGEINIRLPTADASLYNSSHVLQQNPSLANLVTGSATGAILIYDSQNAFYTDPAGATHRSFGHTFQSSYAGPWPTYTGGTSSNWTHGGGTNLYLGYQRGGSNYLNGNLVNVSIWKTR